MSKNAGQLYLAIDQGGHASRALVFDAQGRCHAQAEVMIATHTPQVDWVEHDPAEMVASVRAASEQALRSLGAAASQVVAAGLATQRSSFVCWHRQTGRALSPVISWQDRRAQAGLAALALPLEQVREKTGLFANAHYGASKMNWCLQHLPEVAQAATQQQLVIAPLASYLLFALLQEQPLLADPANAQRTLLMNLASLEWDAELLARFHIPPHCLPPLVQCRHPFGHLRLAGRDIPLTVCTGDQSAALFAEGRPQADCWYANLGTGGFVQRLCDDAGFAPRHLHSVVYSDAVSRWQVLEGTVNGAARALDWLAAQYPGLGWLAQLEGWLRQYPQPGLFINGISGLGSPFWLPALESGFINAASPGEQFAAVVESIVFLLYHNMRGMSGDAAAPSRLLLSGGLARSDGLCQRLADLSGLQLSRLQQSEATARGLAYLLAGLPPAWNISATTVFLPGNSTVLRSSYHEFMQQLTLRIRTS